MIPDGWTKLPAYAVYIKGTDLIVLGEPPSDDEQHNCDEMGCGSLDCVIVRGSAHRIGIEIRDAELPLERNSATTGACSHNRNKMQDGKFICMECGADNTPRS